MQTKRAIISILNGRLIKLRFTSGVFVYGENMKIFYSSKLNNTELSWSYFVHVMTRHMGLPADTEVLRTHKGKPFFMRYDDIHFSVTHTKNHWLCVFSESPVGIDAELISRRISNPEKIISRFYSDAEAEAVSASDDQHTEMLSVWTKKESCLKLRGDGVFRDMKHLDVCSTDTDVIFRQTVMDTADADDRLIVTVCIEENDGPKELCFDNEEMEIINIDGEL